jgi:hypothetical protein
LARDRPRRFELVDAPEGPVHIYAAGNDHTLGYACEGRHQVARLLFTHGEHIQDHFGREPPEVGGVFRQAIPIAQDFFHPSWKFRSCLAAMKDADLVSCSAQISDDMWPHEAGASNDQKTLERRPPLTIGPPSMASAVSHIKDDLACAKAVLD